MSPVKEKKPSEALIYGRDAMEAIPKCIDSKYNYHNMDENKVAKTFEDLGVEPRLLKAIGEMGFESPMPIQEMVIPHLLERWGCGRSRPDRYRKDGCIRSAGAPAYRRK